MTALTKARNTKELDIGRVFEHDAAAGKTFYAGALIALDANGNATPGATATGLVAAGRCEEDVNNASGDAGDKKVRVKVGAFRYANSSAGDAITKAEIGDNAFIVDDQTVAKTSGGGTRSVAGRIVAVDALGVFVELGVAVTAAPGGSLAAGSNLSDVGSVPTARANLGVAEALGTPVFTIGAEAGNAISVGIQLKNSANADLARRACIKAYLSDDANGDTIAGTAPSGGIVSGADGALIPQVAGKAFDLVSEADGDIDLTITEAGADTWYLILVLPDGRLVPSGAITFA